MTFLLCTPALKHKSCTQVVVAEVNNKQDGNASKTNHKHKAWVSQQGYSTQDTRCIPEVRSHPPRVPYFLVEAPTKSLSLFQLTASPYQPPRYGRAAH